MLIKLLKRTVAVLAVLAITSVAYAQQTQTISVCDGGGIRPDESSTVGICYTVNSDTINTTGVGFRVHWDSSLVTFNSYTPSFTSGFIPIDTSVSFDDTTSDFDGDATTDRYTIVAYVGLNSTWPSVNTDTIVITGGSAAIASMAGSGTADQMLRLVNMSFTGVTGFDNDSMANFGISRVSNNAGSGFNNPGFVLALLNNIDVDGDGDADGFDLIMLLRRLSGSPPGSVASGISLPSVGGGDPRTSEEIATIIDGFISSSLFDVDNDGDADGFDGIMILRSLSGTPASSIADGITLGNSTVEQVNTAIAPLIQN